MVAECCENMPNKPNKDAWSPSKLLPSQVWRRRQQKGRPAQAAWQCALTLCAPVDEDAVAQARRRRRAPPTPAINQLAWTKDDTQVHSHTWNKRIWLGSTSSSTAQIGAAHSTGQQHQRHGVY